MEQLALTHHELAGMIVERLHPHDVIALAAVCRALWALPRTRDIRVHAHHMHRTGTAIRSINYRMRDHGMMSIRDGPYPCMYRLQKNPLAYRGDRDTFYDITAQRCYNGYFYITSIVRSQVDENFYTRVLHHCSIMFTGQYTIMRWHMEQITF